MLVYFWSDNFWYIFVGISCIIEFFFGNISKSCKAKLHIDIPLIHYDIISKDYKPTILTFGVTAKFIDMLAKLFFFFNT